MNIPRPTGKHGILEASRKLCEGITNEELARRMEKHAGTEAARAINRPRPGSSQTSPDTTAQNSPKTPKI
jgi:hypothetical protein